MSALRSDLGAESEKRQNQSKMFRGQLQHLPPPICARQPAHYKHLNGVCGLEAF